MSQLGSLKYTYLAYLSQPAADRIIYREIEKCPVRSIVELGIGTAVRAQRMIAVALRHHEDAQIRYTGIDLFEDRDVSDPGLGLREAYRLLRQQNVRVQLVPGDPYTALARIANTLAGVDLIVISADQDPAALDRAWTFVPRMIHDNSLIFHQSADKSASFVQLTKRDVEDLAGYRGRRRKTAA